MSSHKAVSECFDVLLTQRFGRPNGVGRVVERGQEE